MMDEIDMEIGRLVLLSDERPLSEAETDRLMDLTDGLGESVPFRSYDWDDEPTAEDEIEMLVASGWTMEAAELDVLGHIRV